MTVSARHQASRSFGLLEGKKRDLTCVSGQVKRLMSSLDRSQHSDHLEPRSQTHIKSISMQLFRRILILSPSLARRARSGGWDGGIECSQSGVRWYWGSKKNVNYKRHTFWAACLRWFTHHRTMIHLSLIQLQPCLVYWTCHHVCS